MKFIFKMISTLTIVLILSSCNKEWLEEKQNAKLIIPTTLNDMDLLLNEDVLELDARGASEIACDDYEFTMEQFNSLYYAVDRDIITWKSFELPKFGDKEFDEWDLSYSEIQICNSVLDALKSIQRDASNMEQYNRIKGTALYHRAKQHLNLAMTFCNYYDKANASKELGIPLKLTSEITEKITRPTLEDTYTAIISDLKEAISLLPLNQSSQTFVAKGGAFGLLARTYLFTDNYIDAFNSADSSFKYHSYIENYNTVNGNPSRPFGNLFTREMHILGVMRRQPSNFTVGRITKELYDMFDENDLRKSLFFRINPDGKPSFRGSYRGFQIFTATATDEILLIKAECAVRLNRLAEARNAINLLLNNRYKQGTYNPILTNDPNVLLHLILKERRKELITRGLRWHDLKRLNRDTRFSKSLERRIGDDFYTLPANDPKYVFPIPKYVKVFAGIQ